MLASCKIGWEIGCLATGNGPLPIAKSKPRMGPLNEWCTRTRSRFCRRLVRVFITKWILGAWYDEVFSYDEFSYRAKIFGPTIWLDKLTNGSRLACRRPCGQGVEAPSVVRRR